MMKNNNRIESLKTLVENSLSHWQYKLEEAKHAAQQMEFNLDFLSWYRKLLEDKLLIEQLDQHPDYLTFWREYQKKYQCDYIPLGQNFTDTSIFGYPLSIIQQYYKDNEPCSHDGWANCWKCGEKNWRTN